MSGEELRAAGVGLLCVSLAAAFVVGLRRDARRRAVRRELWRAGVVRRVRAEMYGACTGCGRVYWRAAGPGPGRTCSDCGRVAPLV